MVCDGDNLDFCGKEFNINNFPNMKLYNPEHELTNRISHGIELPLSREDLNSDIISELKNDNVRNGNAENLAFELARAKKSKKVPLLHVYKQVN